MNFNMHFKKNKLVVILACLGFSSFSYASNPQCNDCTTPPGVGSDPEHSQDGSTVEVWSSCIMENNGPTAYAHGSLWMGCDFGAVLNFTCANDEGHFNVDDYHFAYRRLKCNGPVYNFDIHNKTSYDIVNMDYNGQDYKYHPSIGTNSNKTFTDIIHPDGTLNTGSIVVDPDFAIANNKAGSLLISANFLDKQQTIANPIVSRGTPSNYKLISDPNIIPTPPSLPIACMVSAKSTTANSPGSSYIIPTIMEGQITMCVKRASIHDSESYIFHLENSAGLEKDDLNYYPPFNSMKSLEDQDKFNNYTQKIEVSGSDPATKVCASIPYYFKTTQNGVTCSEADNTGVGKIIAPNGNNLSLAIAVTKVTTSEVWRTVITGVGTYQVQNNNLIPNYSLTITNPSLSPFSIYNNYGSNKVGVSDDGNSISVSNGIFESAELDLNQ